MLCGRKKRYIGIHFVKYAPAPAANSFSSHQTSVPSVDIPLVQPSVILKLAKGIKSVT